VVAPPKPILREKVKLYRPLIVITLISVLGGLALSMNGIMCFLAALKLFDLKGFTSTFRKYDVLAQKSNHYAMSYPFIELGLGLLMLSGILPVLANIAVAGVMLSGIPGILKVIRSGDSILCACVGTAFALPVGRITLAENATMAAMAIVNILMILTAP
jgi:hypothetical protein